MHVCASNPDSYLAHTRCFPTWFGRLYPTACHCCNEIQILLFWILEPRVTRGLQRVSCLEASDVFKSQLSDSVAMFTDGPSTGSSCTLVVPQDLSIYKGSLPGLSEAISGTRLFRLTSDGAIAPLFSASTALASTDVRPGILRSSTALTVDIRKPDATHAQPK